MRPPPELLHHLSRTERMTFELADFLARPGLAPLGKAYTTAVMGALIWSCGGKRLDIRGLEHMRRFDKNDSMLVVANHRSFFDFFVISYVLYFHTEISRRMLYPTRSTFFYDHPVGTVMNLAMSAGRMFPPILRDQRKRDFNKYSLERCIDELAAPGTVLCVHPEGTRGKGADPLAFLPAQPGAGRLALAAPRTIPVFILGMSNSLGTEFVWNWTNPNPHRIVVSFGPPVDFEDLKPKANTLRAQKLAADRCMERIRALAPADL
jgi:1-acyl-sn-glycerol-3-phosphate acyltransferase